MVKNLKYRITKITNVNFSLFFKIMLQILIFVVKTREYPCYEYYLHNHDKHW